MKMQTLEAHRGAKLNARHGLSPLLLENARLRRLCAQTKAIVDRHALALREADHRIKNSLQIVSNNIGMQARRETNAATRSALLTAAARINAIARIHDALQLDHNTGQVELGRTVETMCQSIGELVGVESAVQIVVDAAPVTASTAIAQPLVIAINELIINALRHAFPDGRGGEIKVQLTQHGNEVCIVVSDNGVGLPAGFADGKGYGMSLVRMLTSKLGGALKVDGGAGSCFTLSAPLAG